MKRLELRFSDAVYNLLESPDLVTSPSPSTGKRDDHACVYPGRTVPSAKNFARALFNTGIGCERIVYALRSSDRIGGSAALLWIEEVEDELRVVSGRECKLYARDEVGGRDA